MKNAFISYLKSYALKAMVGLAGWRLALANIAMKYGWNYVSDWYDAGEKYVAYYYGEFKNSVSKKQDVKNAEKYDQTLNDGVSEDEQKDTSTDLLNGH